MQAIPILSRLLVHEAPMSGDTELFLLGRYFGPDCRVFFRQSSMSIVDGPPGYSTFLNHQEGKMLWEAEARVDANESNEVSL